MDGRYRRLKLSFLRYWNRFRGFKKMDSPSCSENLRQRIHDLERELSLKRSLLDALQIDVETLQSQLNQNNDSFLEYKGRIESEISGKWMEKTNSLRKELDDQRETFEKTISDLKIKLTELENKDVTVPYKEDDEFLKEKLVQTQDENDILRNQQYELNLQLQNQEVELTCLKKRNKDLEEHYEETVRLLESKKEALTQATEALKEVQENNALLSNELAALKAGPVDSQKRGNSLFAEVDDNRQQLKKNISILKSKVNEYKVKLSAKQSENNKLMNENDRLIYEIQKMDRLQPEHIDLIESYKSRIKDLEGVLNSVPKQELPQIDSNEYQRLKWALDSLESTRKSHQELQLEFNKLSQERILDKEELFSTRQEIKRLKNEISNLKMDYELKLKKFTESIKNENEYSENNGCKENLDPNLTNDINRETMIKTSKSVRFAEDL